VEALQMKTLLQTRRSCQSWYVI